MTFPTLQWLSRSPSVPARWDLRLVNWTMDHATIRARDCERLLGVLDWRPDSRLPQWRELAGRAFVVAVGVDDPAERAGLLGQGFGDALGSRIAFVELGTRLLVLKGANGAMPRRLAAGPVTLDLFHRDGWVGGRWLGLHPREFKLLWRLAETPGTRVSSARLLREVWRLEHLPETNSLAVHVSRLRAKLAIAGCDWLVRTDPEGGYRLVTSPKANPNAKEMRAHCA
ncbi:winged helix-turn-helix domain-containing protein [Qipengyuania sp.]|uniref:winged helix-turn-helix domain-containing protein n=1 Tax=Qipengyuania sp. TaxID=2004515 RepID=UPI003BA9B54A